MLAYQPIDVRQQSTDHFPVGLFEMDCIAAVPHGTLQRHIFIGVDYSSLQ
jgi:hypothetical protein